jgi:hypothetical protein
MNDIDQDSEKDRLNPGFSQNDDKSLPILFGIFMLIAIIAACW